MTKKTNNKVKRIIKDLLVILVILITIIAGCIILDKNPTYADSGFSTSHSGSSSDSSDGILDFLFEILIELLLDGDSGAWIIIIVLIIIYAIYNKFKSKSQQSTNLDDVYVNDKDKDIENEIKQYIQDFNKQEFLTNGYKMYCNIQDAWMNSKLEDVRNVITDELYTMYESQLATLEVKGEQNIMKDFVLKSCRLKNVTEQNGTITIGTTYVIEFYDYIIDANTKKTVRGESNRKMRVVYEMKFRKTLNENAKLDKCPNCGVPVDVNSGGICRYCKSKLVSENTNWVLTEKNVVHQEYL